MTDEEKQKIISDTLNRIAYVFIFPNELRRFFDMAYPIRFHKAIDSRLESMRKILEFIFRKSSDLGYEEKKNND